MKTAQLEKRQIKVSIGELPCTKIETLPACHPFTQQIDIVFPSNPSLLDALGKLETSYCKAKTRISDVVNNRDVFVNSVEGQSNLLLVSHTQQQDDVWCIDPRAFLTICVSKETYERLGLTGQKLPFKTHSDCHRIDIPLTRSAHSLKNWEKIQTALLGWDKRRQAELGKEGALWDISYCSSEKIPPELSWQVQGAQICQVKCSKKEMGFMRIPVVSLSPIREKTEDALEDWSEHIHSLFEWIGMTCLGSQRLHANDRVDPFVAVYDPPSPSYIGDITHLRWKGLLSPAFVQDVLNVVIASFSTKPPAAVPPFVAITGHALTSAPVSYIPYVKAEFGEMKPQTSTRVPYKLPRLDGEDTWSLLLEHPKSATNSTEPSAMDVDDLVNWCLMESIGQWDKRWGSI